MPESRIKRPAHPVRILFRWLRILLLLAAGAIIGIIFWCNVVGVPAFIERAIQREVERRGIELRFSKLRLKGVRQLVAGDVSLRSHDTNAPVFKAREAEFIIDRKRLRAGEFELTGIHLTDGHLTLPLDAEKAKSLVVTNINTDIHFDRGDALRVLNLTAEALGAKARLSGEVTNLRQFNFGSSRSSAGTNHWQQHVLEVLEIAEGLNFRKAPELNISLTADGKDLTKVRATVTIRSDEASSKWGTFDSLQIFSSIAPAVSNSAVRGDFLSEITGLRSKLGTSESLRVKGETLWTRNMEQLLTNWVEVTSGTVNTRWFRFDNAGATLTSSQAASNAPIYSTLQLVTGPVESSGSRAQTNLLLAELKHPLPFPTPAAWLARLVATHADEQPRQNELSGKWTLSSSGVQMGPASVDAVNFQGDVQTVTGRDANASLFARLQAPWQMAATNIRAGEIAVGSIESSGNWRYPELSLTNLGAQLYGGYLRGAATLNVVTREAHAQTESDFPYEKLSTLLDEPVQRWFAQFQWEDPPYVQSKARARFPEWTSRWNLMDVAKTLEVEGHFVGSGSFRGIPAQKSESHFQFTNFTWTLPDLRITRPEGEARLSYVGNVRDGSFSFDLDSRIDLGVLKALVPKEHQAEAAVVKFAQPPHLRAKATGDWDDDSRLNVSALLVATNFFVKEQAFSDIRADILITNRLIHCFDVVAHRGKEEVRAPYVRVDLPGEIMFVTNVVSRMDPYIAMSLIGEEAYDAINPYRFAQVPTVRVNGTVPLRHWSKADLRFEVAGEEFSFWKFRMPYLAGDVHWRADHISFSNVTANFYGGKAKWSGYFVIDHRDDTANYSFSATTTNTELKYLLADLTGRTNHIEGTLNGELVIASANSGSDRSWNGYGSANLQDGFLWDVPVFGIFTPVLNGIAPGLGTSRVSAGSGTFTITNSVVYTRDMQVRAQGFRLGYKGRVDIDGNLDAVAEAQIFRDAWVVGKLFSIALWPVSKAFEAKVSGTVDAPKTDLRYVPKFLLAPFRLLTPRGDGATRNDETEVGVPK